MKWAEPSRAFPSRETATLSIISIHILESSQKETRGIIKHVRRLFQRCQSRADVLPPPWELEAQNEPPETPHMSQEQLPDTSNGWREQFEEG